MAAWCCRVSPPAQPPCHLLCAHRARLAQARRRRQSLTFILSPPPLCKCVTVRRDIVRRSVGSTKPWLCWPPYENSSLFSFFLEVLVACTHVSLSCPHPQPLHWPVQQPPVQPSPAAHTSKSSQTQPKLLQPGRKRERSVLEGKKKKSNKKQPCFYFQWCCQFSSVKLSCQCWQLSFSQNQGLASHHCKHREGWNAGCVIWRFSLKWILCDHWGPWLESVNFKKD